MSTSFDPASYHWETRYRTSDSHPDMSLYVPSDDDMIPTDDELEDRGIDYPTSPLDQTTLKHIRHHIGERSAKRRKIFDHVVATGLLLSQLEYALGPEITELVWAYVKGDTQ